MKRLAAGFTFVEMLVVLAVIGILAAVIYPNFSQSSATARDAQRKADLRLVQNALEAYRLKEGRFPPGCNGGSGDGWSGERGTSHACPAGDEYIVGLAPAYIPVLPKDPKSGTGDYGYVYRTNAEGTVYKFVARNSVETEVFNDYSGNNGFMACDIILDHNGDLAQTVTSGNCADPTNWPEYIDTSIPIESNRCSLGVCNRFQSGGGHLQPAPDCFNSSSGILNSYAVWGGYGKPDPTNSPPAIVNDEGEKEIEYLTERVVCDMP